MTTNHQPLSPRDLLDGAEHLLKGGVQLEVGPVERAAALLARQALEMCMSTRLVPFGLDPTRANFRAQLLCLQGTMGNKDLARETAALWSSLSTLVHHLGYEMGPTSNDVAALIRRTLRITSDLQPKTHEPKKG